MQYATGGTMDRLWLWFKRYGGDAAGGIGLSIVLVTALNSFESYTRSSTRGGEDLQSRIKSLTASLNSAATTISQIEDAIKQRQELVSKLQHDAEIASSLKTMNQEQLNALSQVLRGEMARDKHEDFWFNQATALGYTLLGVLLSEGYRWFQRRRRRTVPPAAPQ
jgi:hypothetical protein